jgi:tRNA threonylcarbamoyladenosine biosynthesis protein TsaE
LKIIINSNCRDETEKVGSIIGSYLQIGDVILLSGELGAGKTVIVKGIARSLRNSQEDPVISPTFTLIQEYNFYIKVYHIDLYRIFTSGELDELGIIELLGKKGITIIEWADKFLEYLLDYSFLNIHINVESEEKREILINFCGNLIGSREEAIIADLKDLR